jgi:hypothetical protein
MANLNEFALNFVARFELPSFNVSVIWLINDAVDIVSQRDGLYGTPNINAFISQAYIDLDTFAQGKSPLPGPYRKPGRPTWITSPVTLSITTD